MFKKLSIVALMGLALSSTAHADTVGFEIGTYLWTPDYSGVIAVADGNAQGSQLDLKSDLGFSNENNNIFWLALEHPIPILPNIKFVSSNLNVSSDATLTRDIVFGDQVFTANEDVTTQIDMSNTELTLYYELLDNWVNLDAGLTFRQYDGVIALKTDPDGTNINQTEALDFIIPLVYLRGRFDLPMTGFFVDGEINIIGYDGDSVSDTSLALGYESEFGLGGKAGYRTFSMEVEEADFSSDLDFSGAYVSVFYHF